MDSAPLHDHRLYLAYSEGDKTTQDKELAWFAGKRDEALAVLNQAMNAAALGQHKTAAELYRRGRELALRPQSELNPQRFVMASDWTDALLGKCPTKAPRTQTSPIVVALCGDTTAAQKVLEKMPSNVRSGPFFYLRGHALLGQGRASEAAAIFADIIRRKAANWGPEYPAAHVALARAATLAGETAQARQAYEAFFSLWKDADPDVPVLLAARKEYAALQ